jgi:hypothetical protein
VDFRPSCWALIAATFWLLVWPAPHAHARGALTLSQDVCLLFVGPDYMYFSGYLSARPRKRFCEDVPDIGETIFTMDFGQDEMREMKVDFRIMRDIGEDAERDSLDEVTVAYLPPKAYPTGSISLRHSFVHAGNYAGLVTADGPHGEHWVARFPFAVGRPYPVRLPYYLLTAAAVLVMLLYFWGRDDPRAPKPLRRR